MSQITVTLPDGSQKDFNSGISVLDVARSIGSRLAQAALVAKVDGHLVDLTARLDSDATVTILTERDPEALQVYRHSSAHLLALAVTELFPGTQLGIGPSIENGFYYDFQRETPFTAEELDSIEQRMLELVKADYPFERLWMDKPEGLRSAARIASSAAWKFQDPQLPKSIWYHTDAQFLGFRVIRPLIVPSAQDMHKYWTTEGEPD